MDDATFKKILERAVGRENAAIAFPAFRQPASVSVRINPSKVADPEAFVASCFGGGAEKVPWSPFGYLLPERPQFTLDPLFHAGCYYVQDSSAMFAGEVFRNLPGRFGDLGRPVRVLDLCAAPGGKTTDLAASLRLALGDGFVLVANEVVRSRAGVLADNVAVWGDPNVVVTSVDPKAFASFGGFFDAVLADVPCSGEGMFRKDPEAAAAWSEDVVRLCAARQRRILSDVWPSLREGGVLLYSTCTFEEAENDGNVEWAAQELGAETLPPPAGGPLLPTRTGTLLVPGFVKGEGQFVAALLKTSPSGTFRGRGNVLDWLHPLLSGIPEEVVKGTDLVPTAGLALSIAAGKDRYPKVELDRETALRFLRREVIFLKDAPRGFVLVCHEGHPLGFVKNLGNRCNNLHPLSRRIRMALPERPSGPDGDKTLNMNR